MTTENQRPIPCSIIRGGTSRGAYFVADDLPADATTRNRVLCAVMGGPDALQIDGLGGGHPLTSKVAIVSPASRADADVDYLFLQVSPTLQTVSDAQNCGNLLAGVGIFAASRGLVSVGQDQTRVTVHMANSGKICELEMPTPGGALVVGGDTAIDGVPGTGAPIVCNFLNIAGSACGNLLPTGSVIDEVDNLVVTCIDNGMPVVVLRASDLGIEGTESPEKLDAHTELKARLEAIRLKIGPRMNLGDVRTQSVPKLCLVSKASAGGVINTRTFIPHECHKAIGVLGAVSVATACLLPGSVCFDLAVVPDGETKLMDVEHPSGSFRVSLDVRGSESPEKAFGKAGVIRTARTIMSGEVLVPESIF